MSFINPLPGGTLGRTDMGIDISAKPGTPGLDPVPGESQFVGTDPSWYAGQPYYNFKVLSGPFAGKFWYVAEQFRIGLRQGAKVTQGQRIGTYASSGTATEWGWGTATPGETLAKATTGYHEGQQTVAGKDFSARVRGAKAGGAVPGGAGATRTVTGWKVVASQESDGGQGACGPIGSGGLWYSELSTVPMGGGSDFAALGKIPCGTPLLITNPANGKSITARKRDVGAGSSFLPVMGLYPATVAALGLSGGKYTVIIARPDGGPLHPVRGTPTTTTVGGGSSPRGSGAAGGGTAPSPAVNQSFTDYVALRDAPRDDPDKVASLGSAFAWYFSQFRDSASKVFG